MTCGWSRAVTDRPGPSPHPAPLAFHLPPLRQVEPVSASQPRAGLPAVRPPAASSTFCPEQSVLAVLISVRPTGSLMSLHVGGRGVGGGREHCGPSGRPRMPRSAALHLSNWTDHPLLQTSSSVWPPNVPVTTPVPELRAPALLPAHAFGDQAHPVASWVALRSPAAASWGLPHSSPRPLSARAGFPCPPGEPLTLPGYLQPWPSLSSPTDAPVGRWPILFPPLCPGPPGRVSPRLVLRLLSVVSVHAAISLEAEK